MKKKLILFVLVSAFITTATAQLTGTKNIPGDYATLASAIADLNAQGAGTGGVTFNIATSHTETFPSVTSGRITTQTGSETNPIIFQRNGTSGNPVITAALQSVGQGGAMDAILYITGCDYITIDGLKLQENAGNSNTNRKMEWGIAILKFSGTNGSQNITIKNCIISLNKTNSHFSKGIYSNNHGASNTSPFDVTSFSGTNSNLKIFSNTLSNCYSGIYLEGYSIMGQYDQYNQIGVGGSNIISSFGGDWDAAYGIIGKYQTNLKVANNNITTNLATGTGNLTGIYLTSATNANFDVYSNYISMQYAPTNPNTANFRGIYSDMGANGTSNVINVYNNTISNCSYTGAISAAVEFINLINLGVTANIYGNVVSNNTITGSTSFTGNSQTRYLYCKKELSLSGAMVAHDNQVINNSQVYTLPYYNSGVTFYMAFLGSGTTLDVYNNSVQDDYAGTLNAIYGLYVYYNDEIHKNIYNNTVKNIFDANGGFTGIYIGNGTLSKVYKNSIQNINSSLEGVTINITGIHHSSGNSAYYYNNMISDLNNEGSVSTEGYDYNTLNGIYVDMGDYGTIKNFYNNTVYLNSPNVSTDFGSSAFCSVSLYGINLRNNIFVNTSANAGSGKTVGIRTRSVGFTGYASNYNCIYAGTPSTSNLLFTDGSSTAQTLLQYRTLVTPQELQSVTEMPPFVNITTRPYDVHLLSNVATQCEAGGTAITNPVAITVDFDNQARYPNSGYPVNPSYPPAAPDIGADEIGGIRIDITAPAIVYTPLGNTPNGSARILIAKITDGTGVPTTGNGRPRLYWKKNSLAWQGVYSTSIGGGGNYSFSFGGGSITGDVISYYVVAQDMIAPTPNVGAYPWIGAAGFTFTPPACSTPPATPYTYLIVQGISGEFHVGVGKTYTTLTAAVNDLNIRGLIGPLTFILDDNTYPNESYPIVFNPNGGSGQANMVTIKPNSGATPVLSGSVAGSGLIMFKGIDYVTINGSNSNGSDKSLTIQNNSSTGNAYVIGITSNGSNDGSNNITVKNCILKGNNSDINVGTYIIVFNQDGGLTGGRYDNCLFENNTIIQAKYAILIEAASSYKNNKIRILNNIIGSTNPSEYITRWGIAVSQSDSTLIQGNDIMGPAEGVALEALFGIYPWDNATNTRIIGNKVHDWIAQGRSSIGIKFDISINNPPPTEISNNVIYNIGCYGLNAGVNQNLPYGIFIRSGGNIKIWNNSIYLSGPYLSGNDMYMPSSACIGLYNYVTDNIDIRNNILRNSMTNSFPGPYYGDGKAYGIMIAGGPEMFSLIDNNDYFIDGFEGQIAQHFSQATGYTNFPTLESWQYYTGQEMNSINADPLYISTSDLQLQVASPAIGMAVPIAQITTDYLGNPRSATFPTIGAYEYTYTPPTLVTWTGLINTNWGTKGNWTPTVVPTSVIQALIPSSPAGSVFPVVPSTGSQFEVKSVTVEEGASVTIQAGSTLIITDN